jgi:hypothetical protein
MHGKIRKNKVAIKLNPVPSWNMKLDIGAASMQMDLSLYKIDTMDVDAGASSMEIKLGDRSPLSVLSFDAGASSIELSIPRSSGCQISSDSFLISKKFEGFSKNGDRTYQTENFVTSKNRIYITVNTAVSSIEIKRY